MSEQTSTRRISRTEIAMRVRDIIADNLGRDVADCPESATADELGMDELDAVEIVMAVEESIDIDLDAAMDSALTGTGTIGQFIDLVEGAVAAGGIA